MRALIDMAQLAEHQLTKQKVRFLVTAHAWVVRLVGAHVRGNWSMFLSHIDVSLPLFFPPSSLFKNKKRFNEIPSNTI